jgi:hypothetical protein
MAVYSNHASMTCGSSTPCWHVVQLWKRQWSRLLEQLRCDQGRRSREEGYFHQDRIVSTKSGKDRGEVVVELTWTTGKRMDILKERTCFVLIKRGDARIIDRVTTLKALGPAVLNENKESGLGICVAHFLESANEKGVYSLMPVEAQQRSQTSIQAEQWVSIAPAKECPVKPSGPHEDARAHSRGQSRARP